MNTEVLTMLPYRSRLPKLSLAPGEYRVMDIAVLAAPDLEKRDILVQLRAGALEHEGGCVVNPMRKLDLKSGEKLSFRLNAEELVRPIEVI